jgi:predicted negative regulator of RcsB-dependent stress response
MGDLDSAIQAMQQARKLSQEERLAERLLKLLIEAEQFSEAITLIQQQPQTWQWQQWLGDVYVLQGDDDMALDVYANALDQLNHVSTPTNEIIESCKGRIQIARAHAYRHLGQLNEAKATYAIAQQHFPDDASIQFYRGLVDFSQGKVEQAVAGCQRAFTKIALNIQQKLLDDLQLDEQYQKLYQHLAKF